MGIVRSGISILRDEGVIEFLRQTRRHLSWRLISLRTRLAVRREEFSLSVDGTTARFISTNANSVEGTLRRFQNEREQLDAITSELNSDDIFYDIGANTGLYSCFASRCCETVIAFEPYPPNISELEQNLQLNGEDSSVFELALADQSDTVELMLNDGDGSDYPGADSPGFGRASITEANGDIEVPTVRGDDLIEKGTIPTPTVVKIDVEGAEPLVVEGLRNGLSEESCRLVFCEVHRPKPSRGSIHDHGYSEDEMFAVFEQLGFDDIREFDDSGSEFVIRAART